MADRIHNPGIHQASDSERAEVVAFTEANPRLAECLPTTLPDGTRVSEFHLDCAACDRALAPKHVWVRVSRLELGAKVVETWETRGVCVQCRTMTPHFYRFHSDGHFDTILGHQWRRGEIGPNPAHPLKRLARWLGMAR